MLKKKSLGSILFDSFNYTFLMVFSILTILPFINIVACSFATSEEILTKSFLLVPSKISFDTYKYIFSTPTLFRSMGVTIFITVAGTLINIAMTTVMAYPLAHKDIIGRKYIMAAIVFTLLFGGGMIPTYLVIKGLGLLNSYWALLIPGAISTFNLILMKNFFQQLPAGLEESAKIDGANDVIIFIRIVIPLSLPAIATFTLFYAVGHWNSFMGPLLYINDSTKWPIQVLLRQIVMLSQGGLGDGAALDTQVVIPPVTVKMACIVVATAPILIVYPFLQKYFVKGVMVGSIKG